MPVIGTSGSTCCIAERTVSVRLAGSAAVRTITVSDRVPGLIGVYIVAGAASRTLSYLVSRMTPMISVLPLSSRLCPRRWPIGFSFGQYFFAAVSLMIAEASGSAASRSLKSRPITIGICMVSKNFGATAM